MQDAKISVPFFPTAPYDVVAITASAGGISALSQVLHDLPANFPIAIAIVQHSSPHSRCLLSTILARYTRLRIEMAETGVPLRAGTVYIACPNWHLLVCSNGTLTQTQTEPIQFTRPSADVLFESLAGSCQNRSIAVVLSGTGRDGAAGIRQVHQAGGITIAQDPATAEFTGMPTAAIQTHAIDRVLPLHKISTALVELVQGG